LALFLDRVYLNNAVSDYLIFLVSFIVGCAIIRIAAYFVFKKLNSRAEKSEDTIADLYVRNIKKYLLPIAYFTVFYLGTKALYLNPILTKVVNMVVLAFITVIGAIFISSIVVFIIGKYWEKKTTRSANNELAMKWISRIIKAMIWLIALLLFLDNIGVRITSLVAGLGVGGIALAFAAQAVLTDIFCFFTIFFDRPFEIGDFIIAGEQMGTVEHIGVKTTRLRALSGEQLVFSNKDLTNARIQNFKTMKQRRVLFTLGVTYDTPYDKLKEIPGIIKGIIECVPDTSFYRAHFINYGPYSLDFEIAYYILSDDFDKYMDIHQEINYRIKENFDNLGIEFAFPTQTLYLQGSSFTPSTKIDKS